MVTGTVRTAKYHQNTVSRRNSNQVRNCFGFFYQEGQGGFNYRITKIDIEKSRETFPLSHKTVQNMYVEDADLLTTASGA